MPEKSESTKKDSRKNQLTIPPAAANDPKAFELVRAWVAQGDLHVSLQMGGWDDPTAWGERLTKFMDAASKAYAERKRGRT